ncbi:MAG TPA: cbb3-type cytochrome c oxidase N-terminal domain-containing protein [Chryseolinea sp.]
MKKVLLSVATIMFSLLSNAQGMDTNDLIDDPTNHPLLAVYIIGGFMVIISIFLIAIAFVLVKTINTLTIEAAKEKAERTGVPYMRVPGWWDRFTQRVNASVPVEAEKNIELDHSYDGIKELDNHLPPWWKWLFYGTIGWSAIYIVVYHFSNSLPLSLEEYQIEVALADEKKRLFNAARPQIAIDENSLTFTQDAAIIEKGKSLFAEYNCGSCHRNDGGGNTIGPNLTDEYWLHGGQIKNIFSTIKNGVVEKGMPAWGKAMSPDAVRDISFFVMSLQGTNPQNAKGPQGEIFKISAEKTDSVKVQASL